jgi:hypothetical protein
MPSPSNAERAYKAVAVVLGFLIHLILDEIWAVEVGVGRLRTKKSFGTALKFLGPSPIANVLVYGTLFGLMYTAWGDHEIAARLRQRARYDLTQPGWDNAPPSQPGRWEPPSWPPGFGISANDRSPQRR